MSKLKTLHAEYRADARFVFLPAEKRGLYRRCHPAAAWVACPRCNAQPGQPCWNENAPEGAEFYLQSPIHSERGRAYTAERARQAGQV